MPIRGHYLLDSTTRLLLIRSAPGRSRRVAQWAALAAIWVAIFAVTGTGLPDALIAFAVAAGAIGTLVWWSRRRLAALPPEWISIAVDLDGVRVETQTATFPTAGGGGGTASTSTGVQTSSANLIAWDAIVRAGRSARCWTFTITGERHVVIPFTAFGEAENASLAQLLVGQGLLAPSR
jgi:hypothetical protein